jgi:hypothetical protein
LVHPSPAQIGLGFSCATRYAQKDATDGIVVHDLQAQLDIVEHDLGAQEARKIDID